MNTRQDITAIIYDKRGRVLSIGKNSYIKTHPMMADLAHKCGDPHKVFLHAEVAAIVRCPDLTKAYRMLVTRYGKDGAEKLAKPCKICATAIESTPIKIVEHT